MPTSRKRSCLAVLRTIAGITQSQLAEIVNCAPVTIQSIELGKLRLSPRLAKRISIETGADRNWLLAGDYKVPPTCPREPGEPYSKRHYQMTRAEIADPRIDPGDLANAEGVWAAAAYHLASSLLSAYRRNKTVFFYYKLRELVEDIQAEFPPAKDFPIEQNLSKLRRQLHRFLLEEANSKRAAAQPERKP